VLRDVYRNVITDEVQDDGGIGATGPIPRGLDVYHKCDVGLCQRPDHLQLLTKPDNTRQRYQRGLQLVSGLLVRRADLAV
jgi:hypothetical protein